MILSADYNQMGQQQQEQQLELEGKRGVGENGRKRCKGDPVWSWQGV